MIMNSTSYQKFLDAGFRVYGITDDLLITIDDTMPEGEIRGNWQEIEALAEMVGYKCEVSTFKVSDNSFAQEQ